MSAMFGVRYVTRGVLAGIELTSGNLGSALTFASRRSVLFTFATLHKVHFLRDARENHAFLEMPTHQGNEPMI